MRYRPMMRSVVAVTVVSLGRRRSARHGTGERPLRSPGARRQPPRRQRRRQQRPRWRRRRTAAQATRGTGCPTRRLRGTRAAHQLHPGADHCPRRRPRAHPGCADPGAFRNPGGPGHRPTGPSPVARVRAIPHRAPLLSPLPGRVLGSLRPTLRWRGGPARVNLYNVQIFSATGQKVLSAFPRSRSFSVPAKRLAPGRRYVWRVWPFIRGRGYTARPMAISWFATPSRTVLAPR